MAVIQGIFILHGSQCTLRLCSRIYSLSVPGGFVALACRQKSPLFVDATACSFSWLFVWFVADDLSFAVRARGTSIGASYAGLMKSFPWPFSASCGRL